MGALVAVTAFAGALFAAITTGILAGRLRDQRTGWLISWTVTTTALCLALGAVAIGHLVGFGPATFRVYQIAGAFLAPFWLAIGMIFLLARRTGAKLATWLFGGALTVITVVIMVLDPVSRPEKFGKEMPLGDVHWTIIPSSLLNAAHALTYLIVIGCLIVAVLRWRSGDDSDADNMHAGVVLAPTGLALVGTVRFAIPGVFAALVLIFMIGAVWYAVARPLAPYDEERDGGEDDWEEEPPPRRPAPEPRTAVHTGPYPAATTAAASPLPPPPRRSGLGDLVAEYRAGDRSEPDLAARAGTPGGYGDPRGMDPRTGAVLGDPGDFGGPHTGEGFGGPGDLGGPRTGEGFGGRGDLGGPHTGEGFGGPRTGQFMGPDAAAGHSGVRGPFDPVGRPYQNGAPAADDPSMPATGVLFSGAEAMRHFGPGADLPVAGRRRADAGGSVRPSPAIYGLLTVFTLIDGSGEAFDRLAEETVEAVRGSEPDTLLFICHSVKSAPLQRIVYEIYRDEVAYTEHQRQAHMERFARERVAHVLAANVIELDVNAAKVVPLPTRMI
ncbi:hypothetical protein Sru01_62940 [Sphaerisporangium rufum]|uniref:ABM domain-containing protein n=1 Tax=Sphaerisporangium rufum TaxID=1381558 RepID=A0A919V3Y1_9ACTN|nr:antibiotic biosynthesis monooxygenase [Sphaerisporangium rufum]GII81312.1 hypothetical protein Sru01_62940 [Sphaerisporangium rufum]